MSAMRSSWRHRCARSCEDDGDVRSGPCSGRGGRAERRRVHQSGKFRKDPLEIILMDSSEQAAKQALTKGAMTRFVTNFPTGCATKNPRYRVEGQSYRSNIIDLPLETASKLACYDDITPKSSRDRETLQSAETPDGSWRVFGQQTCHGLTFQSSRKSMRLSISPLNLSAAFSASLSRLISSLLTSVSPSVSMVSSMSPMSTTFSPLTMYRPRGISLNDVPTMIRSHAFSSTMFAN
mmetsp:Transcript_10731/g.41923  ORF Transcript_10731/g.41923 Transcript_10731/m.41923 type:complete len:236 (-) Transcript_10731:203-910(-)